ncbi:VOC family protein [Maribacter sp. SA7]|uniref:VOC family protein n=1 Tax=Maribacter zhoushanensis TaxID=3030012 RepID=UPI0023EBFBC5|nr:VOC family protein [Maribacter zhoushanensis]MDF4202705.1 VOC family protein [Maribacter zhoushanensis]
MIAWFEIPVANMERAQKFYESILDVSITVNNFGEFIMGLFPDKQSIGQASGALVQHEHYVPSSTAGVLVYFACEDAATILDKVEKAGGQVLQPKTEIGEGHGFMGLLKDTEGNRIAVHSNT